MELCKTDDKYISFRNKSLEKELALLRGDCTRRYKLKLQKAADTIASLKSEMDHLVQEKEREQKQRETLTSRLNDIRKERGKTWHLLHVI